MGLEYSSEVAVSRDEVFRWHERPGAITRLTPPWHPVTVESEAASLADGRAVLSIPPGVRWVAQHSDYRPPQHFTDTLTSLPLRWRHSHEFIALDSSRTLVTDSVDTPVPAAALRPMFRYRHRLLAGDLAAHQWAASLAPEALTVAITGSSGLIGSALAAFLSTGGHRVIRLVRRQPERASERRWDPEAPDPELLDGVDALVHLAGAGIAGRFTPKHKQAIRDSRVGPTRLLAELVATTPDRPSSFIAASAIGYYGPDRGDEVLTEDSGQGEGFLADVVGEWEAATEPARAAGCRVVNVRTGIVQTPRGGALQLFHPLFLAGLGGRLGSGRQWTSWISIDDLLEVYLRALVDPAIDGPVNAVAPQPVRNAEYARALARALGRPALVPTPVLGPKVLLGAEGATELAVASQAVSADRLLDHGHRFRHPELSGALAHLLGRSPLPH